MSNATYNNAAVKLKQLQIGNDNFHINELDIDNVELTIRTAENLRMQELERITAARYTELYDLAPVSYLTLSKDGLIIEINQKGLELLAENQIKYISIYNYISEQDVERFKQFMIELFACTNKMTCEISMINSLNQKYTLRIDGKKSELSTHCLIIMSDITEYRQILQEVHDSYESQKAIINMAGEAFIQATFEGKITRVNQSMEKLTEYSEVELLKMNVAELFSQDELRKNPLKLDNLCKQKGLMSERYLQKKSGKNILIETNCRAMDDNSFQAFVRDITLQRRFENAIKKREFLFRTFVNYTVDWEYWEAEDGSMIYMNPACEGITGYTADEFTKNPDLLNEVVHPQDLELFKKHTNKYHSREYCDFTESIRFRVVSKDFSISIIEHICRPVYDENENYLGRRISNRDISEKVWAEEQLLQSKEDEARRLKAEIADKEKQLNKYAKSLIERDEYLLQIKNLIDEGKAAAMEHIETIDSIDEQIAEKLKNKEDWTRIEEDFVKINPMFMSKLLLDFPELTNTELRVCALIKLDLRSKEIADILNISQKTVDNHRLNIRKKIKDNNSQLSVILRKY